MADPLSISASVAGLVSLGIQATNGLIQYYIQYKGQDADLAKIARRLESLHHNLQSINVVIHKRSLQSNEDIQTIQRSIEACHDSIHELHSEAKRVQTEPTPSPLSKLRATGRRALYPFRTSTLEKLGEDVDDCQDQLSIALQVLDLKEHQKTHDDLRTVRRMLERVQIDHTRTALRDWLKAPDATVNYNIARAKRHATTGEWFVKSPEFNKWLTEENSFLWLNGFAGSGKSVLCSTAILHVYQHICQDRTAVLGFFFFSFTDKSKQDASALLRSLLLQLSAQNQEVEDDLDQLRGTSGHGTLPDDTLLEHLRVAISKSSQTFILIDALDECPRDTTRSRVLSVIRSLKQWSSSNLHLFVTSRAEPDIGVEFDDLPGQKAAMDTERVNRDIRDYISSKLESDLPFRRLKNHHQRIKDYLTEHARGVFRWVDCQLDILRQCPNSPKHIENCLRSLPRSLDETYERMLCNIPDSSHEEACRILTLLCFSLSPLAVCEVNEALAVNTSSKYIDGDSRLTDADDLCRICPGLVEIYSDRYWFPITDKDDDNFLWTGRQLPFLRIAHFSVQEYLESDRIKQGDAASFAMSRTMGYVQISLICMTYLSDSTFLNTPLMPDTFPRYPLAKFAATNWHEYYKRCNLRSFPELQEFAVALFKDMQKFKRWGRICHLIEARRWTNDIEFSDFYSKIYSASLLELDSILDMLLPAAEPEINAKGGKYDNALQVASRYGHETIVQMLLKRGKRGMSGHHQKMSRMNC